MLFFLIWGEAANLRHCPECLMFIFHCCLDELVTGEQLCQPFNPAAREDFLDAIVTPFYNFLHAETQKTVKYLKSWLVGLRKVTDLLMDTDAYWDDSPSKGVGSGASPTPRAASRASGLMTQDNPLLDETVSTLKAGTKDDLMSLTMQPGPSTPVAASPTGVRTPQSPTTGKWLHWSDLSLLGRKEAIHELLIPIATFLGQIASSLENQVEHVAHILANMLPLCREKNKSNEAPDVIFRKTVATLHKKMLQNYFKWARFLNLQESMNHLEWAIIAANLGHDPEALTQLSIAHSPERVLSLQLRQLKHSHYFYLRGTLLKVEADLEEQAEKKLEKKSRLDLIFHKTYREQRSWAHVFFNFRRVYILHAILFQVLVLSAFKAEPYASAAEGITYDDFNECFWDTFVVLTLICPTSTARGSVEGEQ
eukprot:gene30904-38740_t